MGTRSSTFILILNPQSKTVVRLFRQSHCNIMRNALLGVTHSNHPQPQHQRRDITR